MEKAALSSRSRELKGGKQRERRRVEKESDAEGFALLCNERSLNARCNQQVREK